MYFIFKTFFLFWGKFPFKVCNTRNLNCSRIIDIPTAIEIKNDQLKLSYKDFMEKTIKNTL